MFRARTGPPCFTLTILFVYLDAISVELSVLSSFITMMSQHLSGILDRHSDKYFAPLYTGIITEIITQKVSNVSKRTAEVTLCARLLAAQEKPIGIYFISEDIFTLASYYRDDLKDPFFLPTPDWKPLPDTEEEIRGYLHD